MQDFSVGYARGLQKILPGILSVMGIFSVCWFSWSLSFAVLQMCVCVECGHTCAYTELIFHLHAWHSCSVFTALWCGCSVMKPTYLHQTLVWTHLTNTKLIIINDCVVYKV